MFFCVVFAGCWEEAGEITPGVTQVLNVTPTITTPTPTNIHTPPPVATPEPTLQLTYGIGQRIVNIGDVDGRGGDDLYATVDVGESTDDQGLETVVGYIYFGEEVIVGQPVDPRSGIPVISSNTYSSSAGMAFNAHPVGRVFEENGQSVAFDVDGAQDGTLAYLFLGVSHQVERIRFPDDAYQQITAVGSDCASSYEGCNPDINYGHFGGDSNLLDLLVSFDSSTTTRQICFLSDVIESEKQIDLSTANWCITSSLESIDAVWATTSGDINGDGVEDIVLSGTDQVRIVYGPISAPPKLANTDIVLQLGENEFFLSEQGDVRVWDLNDDGFEDILLSRDTRQYTGVISRFSAYTILYAPFYEQVAVSYSDIAFEVPEGEYQWDELADGVGIDIENWWGALFTNLLGEPAQADFYPFPKPDQQPMTVAVGTAQQWVSGQDVQIGSQAVLADVNGDGFPEALFGDPNANEGIGAFTAHQVLANRP